MITALERRGMAGPLAIAEDPSATAPHAVLAYRVVGYAAVFGVSSLPLSGISGRGRFVETIAPGTFAQSLRTRDIRALWNHEATWPLGRNRAGTLVLREDGVGLAFALDLPQTAVGQGVAESVRRGDVTGVSFGFTVPTGGDRWEKAPDGSWLRTLLRVDLDEISPCTFPAFEAGYVMPDPGLGLRNTQTGQAQRLQRLELEVALDRPRRVAGPASLEHLRRRTYLAGLL